jgi:hypothetical protein
MAIKTCPVCESTFECFWPRAGQRFCSKKCWRKNYWHEHKDTVKAGIARYIKNHPDRRRRSQFNWNNSERGKQLKLAWWKKNVSEVTLRYLRRYAADEQVRMVQQARQLSRKRLKRSKRVMECAECSCAGWLECHHVDCNPLNTAIGNLEWLCKSCHESFHAERARTE